MIRIALSFMLLALSPVEQNDLRIDSYEVLQAKEQNPEVRQQYSEWIGNLREKNIQLAWKRLVK